MWPSPKSRHPRWPTWVGGGDFRRRVESALTHPATVAALGVLLLNDLLLKAIWPHSWLTGKLSDVAWLVFALPLLAFLLSFGARRNLRAKRLAFLVAYAGLPLLYAAFNTFDPVHDLIVRGISLAGGAAGSPRDATDSLVIPLAWAAALWVWRRRPAVPGAMRLRWAVLVAGVAALASVATSYPEPLYGVQDVGLNDDGVVFAHADYEMYYSLDGGVTWNTIERQLEGVVWGGKSVVTPRGSYSLDGPQVLRVNAESGPEQEVYSTEFLEQDGNMWVQKVSTEKLNEPREIADRPRGIVYDERSGNLVLAMGIQGVVVGTPAGEWPTVSVGRFEPTDFSFMAKTSLLLSDLKFWTAALALAFSMTGAALVASQHRIEDLVRAVPLALVAGFAALALGAAVFFLLPSTVSILALLVAPIVASLVIGSMPRDSAIRRFASIGIGTISVLASAVLISYFGFSDDDALSNDDLRFMAIAIAASVFAVASFVAARQQLAKYWPLAATSFLGTVALVVLVFMLWLHLGVDEALTKFAAMVLPGIAAVMIARHLAQKTARESVPCPVCGSQTLGLDRRCTSCGAASEDEEASRAESLQIDVLKQGSLGNVGSRMAAAIMDVLLLLLAVEIGLRTIGNFGLGFYSLLGNLELILSFLVFSIVYNPILVGVFTTTPGKRALKLRVVRSDGSRVGFSRAFLRELAKFGPMLLVNAFVMAFRSDRRGLHDLLADTVVVRRDGR